MNPFTSTTLNYNRVQDRRRSFEQAAAGRQLLRFTSRAAGTSRHPSRPPGPVHTAPVHTAPVHTAPVHAAPVLPLVDVTVSGNQHLPAVPVGEPTTVRVA